MNKSLKRAAGAYLSTTLKGGHQMVLDRTQKVSGSRDFRATLGISRFKYKYATLSRLMVVTGYSDGVAHLFVTDGSAAFGPLKVDEAACREVEDNGGGFRGEQIMPCVTDVCKPLAALLCGVPLPDTDKVSWVGKIDSDLFEEDDGFARFELRNVDGEITWVNPTYMQAAIRHCLGSHLYNSARLTMYQKRGNPFDPILFTGDNGMFAVVMPMRAQ